MGWQQVHGPHALPTHGTHGCYSSTHVLLLRSPGWSQVMCMHQSALLLLLLLQQRSEVYQACHCCATTHLNALSSSSLDVVSAHARVIAHISEPKALHGPVACADSCHKFAAGVSLTLQCSVCSSNEQTGSHHGSSGQRPAEARNAQLQLGCCYITAAAMRDSCRCRVAGATSAAGAAVWAPRRSDQLLPATDRS